MHCACVYRRGIKKFTQNEITQKRKILQCGLERGYGRPIFNRDISVLIS